MRPSVKQLGWCTGILGGLFATEIVSLKYLMIPGRPVERWQLGVIGLIPLALFASAGALMERRGRGRSGFFGLISRGFFWFWAAGVAFIFAAFYTKMVFRWW
jgi:hypothetical protein